MIYLEDEKSPLLNKFTRGSYLRTAYRRKGDADLHPLDNVHAKPPVPPRPAEFAKSRDSRLRSQSVTEEQENRAQDTLPRRCGATQTRDSKGWADKYGALHQPGRVTQSTCNATPTKQSDNQGQADRSSVSNFKRDGCLSASLPQRRKTLSGFPWRWPSPIANRRGKVQKANMPNTDQDVSGDSKLLSDGEKSATSYRRPQPQLPPKPAFLFPQSTYKATPTNEQPQCNLTRYDSIPERKDNYPPQKTRRDLVGRPASFRHQKPSHWPDALAQIATHQAERLGNNTLTSPIVGHNGGWGTEAAQVKHQDLKGGGQQLQRGVRRYSSLPRPALASSGNTVEPKTHGRPPSPIRRGETTPTAIVTPTITNRILTTPTTTTTVTSPNSPFSPRSFRRCESLNLEVRNSSHLSRIERSREGNRGGGSNKVSNWDGMSTYSPTSSDSGYSSCSSVSRRSSVTSEGEDDMTEWFGSSLNREEELLSAEPSRDNFSYLMENEKEYLGCLKSMLNDYQVMYSKTPPLIRQHFDLIFKQVNTIYQFHLVLQEDLQKTNGDPQQLALVFSNEQFQCYGRLMVMTPAAQQGLLHHASHINEHFPHLRRNMLKSALRINFYAMILDSFKKEASEEVKEELQAVIASLNRLKRKANTEMTLSTVVHSPVDLRLGGDMLHVGELISTGGGSLQKKRYELILFENVLVITSKKLPYYKYKTHYRTEQLESVTSVGEKELHLNVLTDGQKQLVTLKFTTKNKKNRDEWINELQIITKHNTMLDQGKHFIPRRASQQRYRGLPLDLHRVFPLLREVVDAHLEGAKSTVEWSLPKMISQEEKYIKRLSATLNPEYSRPPDELSDLLENLYNIHKKLLLPALQRSQTVSDFLDYLAENVDELSVYVDYLVVRSQLTVEMDDVPQAGEYILPVQHLYGVYFGLMKELCKTDKCRSTAQRVIEGLQKHVELAQLKVQEAAILNCRIDFQRSGKLILYSPLEVKTRKKEVRDGNYIGLLFKNVIILTRLKQPYYEYVMDIWLDQANLGRPASHECTFLLEVRQGGRREPITYEMSASSPELKTLWQKHLRDQLFAQVDKIRRSWVVAT